MDRFITGGTAGYRIRLKQYEPRDDREEGPEKGLFTGSQGEWVILGPKAPQKDKGKRIRGGKKPSPSVNKRNRRKSRRMAINSKA